MKRPRLAVKHPTPANGPRPSFLKSACRSNLRCAHRLSHTVEHCEAVAAAASRCRFRLQAKATLIILPVVGDPHVAGGINAHIGQPLHAATHITTRWRNWIASPHPRRTGLRPDATQFHEVGPDERGNPNVIVAVDRRTPCGPRAAATVEDGTARRLGAIGPQHRHISSAMRL